MPRNSKGSNIAEIIPDRCIGCQLCVGECPVEAIHMEADIAKIDPEICIGCGRCFNVCPVDAVIFEKQKEQPVVSGVASTPVENYHGVAVFIEVRNGAAAQVSWELLGKARELVEKLGTSVHGFLLGKEVNEVAKDAIAYGCDVVHIIDHPLLEHAQSCQDSRQFTIGKHHRSSSSSSGNSITLTAQSQQ